MASGPAKEFLFSFLLPLLFLNGEQSRGTAGAGLGASKIRLADDLRRRKRTAGLGRGQPRPCLAPGSVGSSEQRPGRELQACWRPWRVPVVAAAQGRSWEQRAALCDGGGRGGCDGSAWLGLRRGGAPGRGGGRASAHAAMAEEKEKQRTKRESVERRVLVLDLSTARWQRGHGRWHRVQRRRAMRREQTAR